MMRAGCQHWQSDATRRLNGKPQRGQKRHFIRHLLLTALRAKHQKHPFLNLCINDTRLLYRNTRYLE